ncbi:MAG: hypothetical protein JWO73_678 [Candidatus Taylorbacteria bacterium]|nr:hypothetical protein [Candidatus Taylorbacteria bacterium]
MQKFKTALKWFRRIVLYPILILLGLLVIALTFIHFTTTPSNDRNWNDDQKVLPQAEINGDLVSIRNIRNFTYTSTTSYTPNYYDKTFDLSKIKKVWYVVEPFSGIPGSAHTFLSFEFEGDQFVSISVEIRKEKGESFDPIKGLFNRYDLMYVIADERDVVKLRSNYRKDLVYVYPMRATQEKARALFTDMVERSNDLRDHPEFYNTVTNTCATNIVQHVDKIAPHKIPLFNPDILFPANSDKLAYDLGLIDTDLSFEAARAKYFINDRALKYADDPDFSVKIRQTK